MNAGADHTHAPAPPESIPAAFRPILAIETSQRHGSVALLDGGGTVDEESVSSAAEDLVASIDRLTSRRRVEPTMLRAITVSIGPGGFTGLRSAVAATKILAEITGAKVVAIPSAVVVAEACATELGDADEVLVLLASKAGDRDRPGTVWCGRLRRPSIHRGWDLDAPRSGVYTIRDVATLLHDQPALRVIGELTRLPELISMGASPGRVESRPIEPRWIEPRWIEPRWTGRACLAAAAAAVLRGAFTRPEALVPLYPREPEAVTLWNLRP